DLLFVQERRRFVTGVPGLGKIVPGYEIGLSESDRLLSDRRSSNEHGNRAGGHRMTCNIRKGIICLLAAVFLAGCGRETKVGRKVDPPAVKVEEAPDVNIIDVNNPGQFPLVAIQKRRVSDGLRTSAVVAPDVNRTVPVVSLTSGRVVEIK